MPASSALLERAHDVGERRAHRKDARHAEGQERLDVPRRDDAAHDHAHVGGTAGAETVEHTARKRQVRARKDGETDDVDVFLDGLGDDLVRRPLEPRVDDLHAGVAQGLDDHFCAAVVAVEPGLGDENLHWSGWREAGSGRGWPVRDGRGAVTPDLPARRCEDTGTVQSAGGWPVRDGRGTVMPVLPFGRGTVMPVLPLFSATVIPALLPCSCLQSRAFYRFEGGEIAWASIRIVGDAERRDRRSVV